MNHQHAVWKAQTLQHWQENRPEMVARLKAAGMLQQELDAAVTAAAQEMQTLRDSGIPPEEALSIAQERNLFLPQEPGADEPMEPDEGAALYRDVQNGLANLQMPGEKEQ